MKNRAERLKDENLVYCPECLGYVSPVTFQSHPFDEDNPFFRSECPHCHHCFVEAN